MHTLNFRVMSLPGKDNPTVAFIFLLVIVIYQLIAGRLLNLKWGTWVLRKDRPRTYWTALLIEAAVAIFGIYLGTL
jgi:hypothetical protein